MSCDRYHGSSGDCLVMLAAAFSVQLAQGRTLDDIQLLSAFFTILGDNLAMIAVKFPTCDTDSTPPPVNPVITT